MGLLDGLGKKKYTVIHEKKKGKLSEWARKHNLNYTKRDDQWADKYSGLPRFKFNDGKEAWHIFNGPYRDTRMAAFHYFWKNKYTDDDGKTRYEYNRYMVVNLRIPARRPTLTVAKEMWDSKFDLDLESIAFNEKFKVKVDKKDEKFAYDVLHPRMMEHLLADQRAAEKGWPFRFENADLYTWEKWPGHLHLPTILEKADYLHTILKKVPEFVWKDQT